MLVLYVQWLQIEVYIDKFKNIIHAWWIPIESIKRCKENDDGPVGFEVQASCLRQPFFLIFQLLIILVTLEKNNGG